ncbi:hypothetical protein CARUB_v10019325mg [Capsella rubella]|uniref:DUF3511 domain-containing protein n=1 Tax=Capsella rubella TaxID=81985 RepID=R0HPT2_9BRAS|nr:uncharacterized protein LOC17886734 [Capsella rubella]EOA25943.1 hypothetical protein CARUB_v10019325mg [Capsella rubella]
MDGFGSNQRTLAVDRWMEIVNGKGYGVGGSTQVYSARPGTPDFQLSIPPPPGATTASTHTTAAAPWRLIDAETKRKKRIATYKAYAMEGKVKATVKKGFRWIKNRYSLIIHG